jgi:hypothetical protein
MPSSTDAPSPPDLTVAGQLLRQQLDIERWPGWTRGLLRPNRPWIRADDIERVNAAVVFVESRIDAPRSAVEAAVVNLMRVARDLVLVLDHDMEYDDATDRYLVSRWYDRFRGHPEHQRAVAEYRAHVALIHNLAAELTRAANLILSRARTAGSGPFEALPFAVAFAESDDRPTAIRYSTAEGEVAQPYPGLQAWPAELCGRSDGSFGVGQTSDAPSADEIARWVAVLQERWGPGAPAPDHIAVVDLPASLEGPEHGGSASTSPQLSRDRPNPAVALGTAVGVLGFAATILQVATAQTSIIGLITGAAIGTALMYRVRWSFPPPLAPAAFVAAAALLGWMLGSALDNDTASEIRPPDSSGEKAKRGRPISVEASMDAYNRTFGRRWAQSIAVDSLDRLDLRLRVTNRASTPTPPLTLDIVYEHQRPTVVTAVISGPGRPTQRVDAATAEFNGYSTLGALTLTDASLLEGARRVATLRAAVGTSASRGDESMVAASYTLGVLPAKTDRTVLIPASFYTPKGGQLQGGRETIVFRPLLAARSSYTASGAARPGAKLRFSIKLNNTGFQTLRPHLRVVIKAHRRGRFVTLTVLDDDAQPSSQALAKAIVNASTAPIGLRIVPGSTRLLRGDTACSREKVLTRLPDGIAAGGIDVGPVRGFQPRDPCRSQGLTRFVSFDARVQRAAP